MGLLGDVYDWFETNVDPRLIASGLVLTVTGFLAFHFRQAVKAVIVRLWRRWFRTGDSEARSTTTETSRRSSKQLRESVAFRRMREDILVRCFHAVDQRMLLMNSSTDGQYLAIDGYVYGYRRDSTGKLEERIPGHRDGHNIPDPIDWNAALIAINELTRDRYIRIRVPGSQSKLYEITKKGRKKAIEISKTNRRFRPSILLRHPH